jgi:hypothetical protein
MVKWKNNGEKAFHGQRNDGKIADINGHTPNISSGNAQIEANCVNFHPKSNEQIQQKDCVRSEQYQNIMVGIILHKY